MTHRISQRFRRLLASPASHQPVHFHLDRDGHAFVCDIDHCDSPALSRTEVDA